MNLYGREGGRGGTLLRERERECMYVCVCVCEKDDRIVYAIGDIRSYHNVIHTCHCHAFSFLLAGL